VTYSEFLNAVKTMRAAQKKCERARLVSCGETLQAAEDAKDEAEAEVDSTVAAYVENQKRIEKWKAVHG